MIDSSMGNLMDLKFHNNSAQYGGAMYTLASTISLDRAIFHGNREQPKGEIINVNKENLNLRSSKVLPKPGAILLSISSHLHLVECRFLQHDLESSFLMHITDSSFFKINQSSFIENTAEQRGLISISNTLHEEKPEWAQRHFEIDTCVFKENRVRLALLEMNAFSKLTIAKTKFLSNTITSDSLFSSTSDVTFTRCTFTKNEAFGSIIQIWPHYTEDQTLQISLYSCLFQSNMAAEFSLLSLSSSMLILKSVQFLYNTCKNVVFLDSVITTSLMIHKSELKGNLYGQISSTLVTNGPVKVYIYDSQLIQAEDQETSQAIFLNMSTSTNLRVANSIFHSLKPFEHKIGYRLIIWQTEFYYKQITISTSKKEWTEKANNHRIFTRRGPHKPICLR